MSEASDFWKGDFGDEYTRRNRVNWRARIPFWDMIIQKTGARSAFELGCNAGWNLSAIKHSVSGYNVQCSGSEINEEAKLQAMTAGHAVCSLMSLAVRNELSFTCGVLIHIPPKELEQTMQNIIDSSCDYVLAVEYESEKEEEIEYRGHSERLWKRPYGKLYQGMGLTLIDEGEAEGFDSCRYWLLQK